MSKTKDILIAMLTENVGSALCDSGGTPQYDSCGNYIGSQNGYGRNFEINKGRDFENEPKCTLEIGSYIELTHNTYHWLSEICEYDQELDTLFHGRFLEEHDPDNDKNWFELIEEFIPWLENQTDEEAGNDELIYNNITGIYGEGKPITVNTYNEESLLDQVIFYKYFEIEDLGNYIILCTHNGADVRGGYSTPRIFSVSDDCGLNIWDNAKGSICCSKDNYHLDALAIKEFQEKQMILPGVGEVPAIDFEQHHCWYTDDGCHFYDDNSCGKRNPKQLEEYEIKKLSDEDNKWERGKLCVKNGKGYCPYCGAELIGSYF